MNEIDRQTDRQTDKWVETPVQIIKEVIGQSGTTDSAEFIDFWPKRFSVQLQKCNARVISKKLSLLSEDNRYDLFTTQYFSH